MHLLIGINHLKWSRLRCKTDETRSIHFKIPRMVFPYFSHELHFNAIFFFFAYSISFDIKFIAMRKYWWCIWNLHTCVRRNSRNALHSSPFTIDDDKKLKQYERIKFGLSYFLFAAFFLFFSFFRFVCLLLSNAWIHQLHLSSILSHTHTKRPILFEMQTFSIAVTHISRNDYKTFCPNNNNASDSS